MYVCVLVSVRVCECVSLYVSVRKDARNYEVKSAQNFIEILFRLLIRPFWWLKKMSLGKKSFKTLICIKSEVLYLIKEVVLCVSRVFSVKAEYHRRKSSL